MADAEDFTMVESTKSTTMAMPAPSATGTAIAAGAGNQPKQGMGVAPAPTPPPKCLMRSIPTAPGRLYGPWPRWRWGVEWKVDVVCLQDPPRDREGHRISHSACHPRERNMVWMAVRKGSNLTTDEPTNLRTNAGDGIIFVDIKWRAEKMIRIVNIDDQKARRTGQGPAWRPDWQDVIRQAGGGTMLAETSTPTTNAGTRGAQNRRKPHMRKKL